MTTASANVSPLAPRSQPLAHALILLILAVAAVHLARPVRNPPSPPSPTPHAAADSAHPGIRIDGDPDFVDRARRALTLLHDRSPAAYDLLRRHAPHIRHAARSGVQLHAAAPVIDVSDLTASHSPTWLASALAHDALHTEIHNRAPSRPHKPQTLAAALDEERRCLAYQLQVLRDLNAPPEEIDWCARQDGLYIDTDGNGRVDWGDYRRRNW